MCPGSGIGNDITRTADVAFQPWAFPSPVTSAKPNFSLTPIASTALRAHPWRVILRLSKPTESEIGPPARVTGTTPMTARAAKRNGRGRFTSILLGWGSHLPGPRNAVKPVSPGGLGVLAA